MSSQRTTRRILSLILALSVGLWAESGSAMLSTAGDASQCNTAMSHTHHAAGLMPCCPSGAAFALAHVFGPPPCCNLSSQQAQPSSFVVIAGKFRSVPLSANGAVGTMFVPSQRKSTLSLIACSPPLVKSVLDNKTDLRI
jgi:hypothetical protein